jgi:hypothetical protein
MGRHTRGWLVVIALCSALVAGCSDGQGNAQAPAPASQSPSSSAAERTEKPAASDTKPREDTGGDDATNGKRVQVIAVAFTNGKVKPPADRVDVPLGQRVRLEVTSDVADEVHVHGYDRLADLEPNETTTITFKASRPGLYEVEVEGAGQVLVQLLVS